MSENQIIATSTPSISFNGSNYYIGYNQVSSNNQNPIILKFTNGVLNWCKEDYETNNDDGRGYGLFWSGTRLYAAFSSTGTQGTIDQQIARFTTQGWLASYGQGGGARVSIILDIDPTNGDANFGTFLYSRLNNGNANSLTINDMFLDGTNLVVRSNAFFVPLNVDVSRMSCSGSSPFDYTVIFTSNLQSATCASAIGCTNTNGVDCLSTLGITNNQNNLDIAFYSKKNELIINGIIEKNSKLNIYDLSGRLYKSIILEVENKFDLSNLKTGIYIAEIIAGDSTKLSKKIVIK